MSLQHSVSEFGWGTYYASAETLSLLADFAESRVSPEDGLTTANSAIHSISNRLDLNTAAKMVQNADLPPDVASLITNV